ncbi:hypothetical protein SAMN05421832_102213 [Psychrobacillus psychrodurans]|nr:hypothetical protein SAMN05421832_102213 [Psychrobacillus psychrodurans]
MSLSMEIQGQSEESQYKKYKPRLETPIQYKNASSTLIGLAFYVLVYFRSYGTESGIGAYGFSLFI